MDMPDVSTWTGWTFFAALALLNVFGLFRGWAIPGPQVDRNIQSYKDTIESQNESITMLLTQNQQLIESQETSKMFYTELLEKPGSVQSELTTSEIGQ